MAQTMGPQVIPVLEEMVPFEREMFINVTVETQAKRAAKAIEEQNRINTQQDKLAHG